MKRTLLMVLVLVFLVSLSGFAEQLTEPRLISQKLLKEHPLSDAGERSITCGLLVVEMIIIFPDLQGTLDAPSTRRFVVYGNTTQAGLIVFRGTDAYGVNYTSNDTIESFKWSANKAEAFLEKTVLDLASGLDYWDVDKLFVSFATSTILEQLQSGEITPR